MLDAQEVGQLSVDQLRQRYGTAREDGLQLAGVNHVAWVSSDMARTVWFWAEGLGMRLTKTIALPDGGQHFFLDGGNGASIAYFWFPDAPPSRPGVSCVDMEEARRTGKFATAHGSVNHVAWNVADRAQLREYRRRIKSLGVGFVSPMLFHTDDHPSGYAAQRGADTTWESFYFTGPDGEYCELTHQTSRPFSPAVDVNHQPVRAKL